jgi:hypothetical protein
VLTIPAELIPAGGKTLHTEINKLLSSRGTKNYVTSGESIAARIRKKGDKGDCINYQGISSLSSSYNILYSIVLSRLTPYTDCIIGVHQCGFQHERFSISIRYSRRNGSRKREIQLEYQEN